MMCLRLLRKATEAIAQGTRDTDYTDNGLGKYNDPKEEGERDGDVCR